MQARITPEAATGNVKLPTSDLLPRYLDKRGVAAMLGLSTRTVSNLLAAGCPHLAIGSRRVRFEPEEVRAWLRSRYGTARRGKLNQQKPVPLPRPATAAHR